jgi:UDP-N-acetyl-D-mannosaminuronic acid dehydrogenase
VHGHARAAEPLSTRERSPADVVVIGLGYVGTTLAVALADSGVRVLGYDVDADVTRALRSRRPHLSETGVGERLRRMPQDRLSVAARLPDELPPIVIVCVGTPVDSLTTAPDLSQLDAATRAIAERVTAETLVILRSTVPVGTSRNVVREALRARTPDPQVAFCPERTIQGRALEELHRLPQIVGASSLEAGARARELFSRLSPRIVRVSSLEAAEAIKLICNAHTDLIYGFGNEVALMAEAMGLNADELIASANLDYPRPDLSRPGFVGGGCLTKDPYLLAHSARGRGYTPSMVLAARRLNEAMPIYAGRRVLDALRARGRTIGNCKVLVSGIAFKGHPETDDVRGAASRTIVQLMREEVATVVGHDFVVPHDRIAELGARPVGLEEGFAGADATMVLTDHPRYRALPLSELSATMRRPSVIFDAFGTLGEQHPADGVSYMKLGNA